MVPADEIAALPDAFVSHSSRDKNLFVRPLVDCLADQGATVWYDEYSMSPGDSLSASIDDGLSKANNGLVVISPDFIRTANESGWTRYELRGIISNSIGAGAKRVVPIWLDVTLAEVRTFSPPLSDLIAITATDKQIEEVALDVLRVIAPQHAGGLGRLRAVMTARGEVKNVDPRELQPSPAIDRRVGGHVPLRALLVTQALSDCGVPMVADFDTFLENLSRDHHHEGELRTWEAIAASYTLAKTFDLNEEKRKAAFSLILDGTFGRVNREAVEILTPQIAGPVLEHFQRCSSLVHGEAIIGEGGLRGRLSSVTNADGAEESGGGSVNESS